MNRSSDNLQRRLGLFPVTNIVIANMIGAGIFTTTGLLMADLHHPLLMLLLWLAGGVIALCGAFCYGALGAVMPEAGGEYIFLSKLYHPVLGFLSGWVSFIVGFSAPIAAAAIGFSEYFFRAFPQLSQVAHAARMAEPLWLKKSIAILIIIAFTLVHLRGIEFGARIQNILTVLKIGLIIALITVGLGWGNGSAEHFMQSDPFDLNLSGLKRIGLSLLWIMFAYSGWNASTYIGSEVAKPEINLPRSLLLGTGTVILLYLCLNSVYIYAVSPAEMSGVISIGGLAMRNLFSRPMETAVSLLIAFALFSSLSAFIILGPRVYYSMAKDGYFFKFVSRIHPVYKVPYMAILLQALLAVIMVLSGTFDQILTYMGFSLGIFPLLAVAGVFRLKKQQISRLIPGFPLLPLIYLLSGGLMLFFALLERPVESAIAIMTVLSGLPLFYLLKKRR